MEMSKAHENVLYSIDFPAGIVKGNFSGFLAILRESDNVW